MDESSDHNEIGGSSSSGGGSSRWNPTKDQISMLENLYKQGIRTPSAEQIQHITARLRAYGHIEGKNVFYWFQNHKARQRQKQKQETIAYFNRFLQTPHHRPHPFLSSPLCPNVLCAPYYLPQCEMGFYPQHPKVLLPGSGIRRMPRNSDSLQLHQQMQERIIFPQETLPLFPLQPTGILEHKTIDSADHTSTATSSASPDDDHFDEQEARSENQPFFDFLSSSGQDLTSDRMIGENIN